MESFDAPLDRTTFLSSALPAFVLPNLGVADYNALQTNLVYRGNRKLFASLSYTLSKATNTTEPDGNGVNPNQSIITRLGEEERGPSVVDQRHRGVVQFHYRLPWNFTAGTLGMFASARPINATTGVDNNGARELIFKNTKCGIPDHC
ncbi:MAG TPA: hypothetical protein VFS76_05370 [Pyrinomonadaceae bacterium]|nr:hypothetical protein [Pyrinomonadaceae bacterium]